MENRVLFFSFNSKIGTITPYVLQNKLVFLDIGIGNSSRGESFVYKYTGCKSFYCEPPFAGMLADKINGFINGEIKELSIPYTLLGSPFVKKVLETVAKIPYGSVLCYSDIAHMIGCGSSRAVGQALKRNPLPLIIPCHRVVSKNGIGGFSMYGGTDVKRTLLKKEGVVI